MLKPGGRGAFSEPLGINLAVKAARDHVPYPYKHVRGADIPLRQSDVAAWMAPFSQADIKGIQLLSMVERGFGFRRTFPTLRRGIRHSSGSGRLSGGCVVTAFLTVVR